MFEVECTAVSSEWVRLATCEEVSPYEVLADLRAAKRRNVNMRLPMEFHLGRETDWESLVTRYQEETGVDEDTARSALASIETSPHNLDMYWIATQLFSTYVDREHDADVVAGFQTLAHETRLTVPPNLMDLSEDAIVKASVPMIVRLSRSIVS
jgi:hypothetical protein